MTLSVISAIGIITDAYQKLGVYAPNEILSDSDATLGLNQLNDLIDDWLADGISLYQIQSVSGAISRQMQDYTVGPGGMIPVARPIRVATGRGVASIQVGGNTTLVDSVSALEWNAIYSPANNTPMVFMATPAAMYYEPQYPLGLLSVSPLPSANGTLTFSALYGMSNFQTLSSSFIMGPGQEQGLKSNLAVVLNPYFGGSPVSPELLAEAQQTKTVLTLTNRMSRAMAKRNKEPPARGATTRA